MRRIMLASLFALLFLVVLRLLLAPDPHGAVLFARAQRLEQAGLTRPALRQYHLLASTHPRSPFAPVALSREASIWLELAHQGETTAFSEAIKAYRAVASTYPGTQYAGRALLQIGAISLNELNDADAAKIVYQEALQGYVNNRPIVSEATLRLGLVAQRNRDGKTAQARFQQVLAKYAAETEHCAQAQYALGEVYESLFRNRDWARNAYETTLRVYPKTVWAGKAKERLGLMLYHEAAPRARRVHIKTPAVPQDGEGDSLMDGVGLVLAARGIGAGPTLLRGWSLAPFYAGYVPANAGRAPRLGLDAWETVAANAGLRTRVSDGGDARNGLQMLQNELDAAHLTLVYSGAKNGQWRLATGYDSARDTVDLQRGSRAETVSSRTFASAWNRSSPLGGPFGLISFEAPGEDVQSRLTVAPIAPGGGKAAAPVVAGEAPSGTGGTPRHAKATAVQSPLAAPGYVYELKPLNERAAHRRTLRRAAEWLRRGRDGGVLLGGEALRTIAAELRLHARAPVVAEETPEEIPEEPRGLARQEIPATDAPGGPDATANDPATGAAKPAVPVTPGATLTPTPAARIVRTGPDPARLRALLAWRGEPLSRWIDARRDAAAYCDLAAGRLNNPSAKRAAAALREALGALQEARALLPAAGSIGDVPDAATRRALEAAADRLDAAREAERKAADAMDDAVR